MAVGKRDCKFLVVSIEKGIMKSVSWGENGSFHNETSRRLVSIVLEEKSN